MSLIITGGKFRGHPLKSSKAEILRPTSGRVREALFSKIQFEIENSEFLDLFAGVGSVGLEALSRGAKSVTLVESHHQIFECLEYNCQKLDKEKLTQRKKQDVHLFCKTRVAAFDIVYADPPYQYNPQNLLNLTKPLCRGGGLVILQISAREKPQWLSEATDVKNYGESQLAFFNLTEP